MSEKSGIESKQENGIESVLLQLIEQLKNAPKVKIEDELWDIDCVAAYLKIAKTTAQRFVVTRPDFPSPTMPRKEPRWFAGEVITWARQNKSKRPVSRSKKAA